VAPAVSKIVFVNELANGIAENSVERVSLLVQHVQFFQIDTLQEMCQRLRRRQVTSGEAPNLKHAFATLLNLAAGEGCERRFVGELRDREPRSVASRS